MSCTDCGQVNKPVILHRLEQLKSDSEQQGRDWAASEGAKGFYLYKRLNGSGYFYRAERDPDTSCECEYISML